MTPISRIKGAQLASKMIMDEARNRKTDMKPKTSDMADITMNYSTDSHGIFRLATCLFCDGFPASSEVSEAIALRLATKEADQASARSSRRSRGQES